MCFRLLLILIFPALFSSAQTFLLCRDQDGISFGLNGKTAEKGVCASSSERSLVRKFVPSSVTRLTCFHRGGSEGGGHVCEYVCMCVYANISREDNKGIVRRGKKERHSRNATKY